MKAIKFLFVSLALLLMSGTVQAQFGKRLGKAVENAAKNATVRKAEQKTDEAVSKGIDKATDPNTYKDKDGNESKDNKKSSSQKQSGNDAESESDESPDVQQDAPKGVKAAEMAYAKSDFVPGDEIIFEDLLTGEQLGEFPSQWDLVNGNIEIAKLNGENVIALQQGNPVIRPFMKNITNYLPEIYTIEFDVYLDSKKQGMQWHGVYYLQILDGNRNATIAAKLPATVDWYKEGNNKVKPEASAKNSEGNWMEGDLEVETKPDSWAHIAISVNKRAVKAYFNGVRFCNVPNYGGGGTYFVMKTDAHLNKESTLWVKNFRVAKGAVPLYDRMMTDGKIITYGITFDVGKSTIKPESMGEINRIAKLMTDNPDLKFSVEGHTDNTGSAATNQKLSDERSASVVAKLVEMGVAKDRLTSAGKGQNSPIADNSTDEGRAKNRRVEFVKIN